MTPMMKTVPLFLKGMCTCVCSDSLQIPLSSMCVFWSCSNCVWLADGSGLGGCWRLLGSNLWRENINPPPTQGHHTALHRSAVRVTGHPWWLAATSLPFSAASCAGYGISYHGNPPPPNHTNTHANTCKFTVSLISPMESFTKNGSHIFEMS